MKHVPQRTCAVCRREGDKSGFIRIVKKKDGSILFDPSGKSEGRGMYVCADGGCIDELKKRRVLSRAFKMQVDDGVYDRIAADYDSYKRNG